MNPLDLDRLQSAAGRRMHVGRKVVVLDQTQSTNDDCHQRCRAGVGDGLLVAAEHQRAGRGQRGRVWSAPPRSSLLFSIVVQPASELANAPFLTAWAAVGIARTLEKLALSPRIKWPNDILIDGRKVSGILVERREATVVGIGINVAIKPHEFPPDLRLPATSLDELLSAPVDRTDLLNQVLDELDGRYQDSLLRGPETLWGEWTILAEDLCGKDVIAWTAQEGVAGRLLDLRPDRGARLRLPHGQERTLPPEMLLRITPPGAPAAP